MTLPGGVKRNPVNEHLIKKSNTSFDLKIMNDYSSKISCLPGTVNNQLIKAKKIETNEHHNKKILPTKTRNDDNFNTV